MATSFGTGTPITARALNTAFAELEAMIVGGAAAAGSLTGTTLASNVIFSSLTSVGTITSGTWSGSFGAVSGANLTNLNADNLASGTVPSARVSGSYTGITGVGTLSAGSIPATLLTGTVASARISGSYTGITAVGTLTSKLNVDGASSGNIGIGDWSGGSTFSAIESSLGYMLLGSPTDGNTYLRSVSGGVYLGSPTNNTLYVTGTTVTTNGSGGLSVAQGGITATNGNVYISGSAGSYFQHATNTGSGQACQWATVFGVYYLVRNTSTKADKENIQPLNGVLTAEMVDVIDVSLWNRTIAPNIPEVGPMAEDMNDISPFLATHGMDIDEDGNIVRTPPNGISPNGWMSLLTIALQESRGRIATLEAKVTELEAR